MKAVLLCDNPSQLEDKTFGGGRLEKVKKEFDVFEKTVTSKSLAKYKNELSKAEILFSTWGMPHLTKEQIKEYFPNLKCVFYAAGSVQDFAQEFLDCGVRVFSAWGANAVPVAEYVFAQITLASKGFFKSARKTSWTRATAYLNFSSMPGNFDINVGLVGAGMIGSMVAEKLKALDVNVYVFDPFLSDERVEKLGVTKTDLHTLFETCDIISNHLANNEQTKGMLDRECFNRMKPKGVFINTGRGAQVVEKDLVRAMRKGKGRLALLDVTMPEPPKFFSPLNFTKNIILTPHMAGSSGNEIWRMADYMIEQAVNFKNGEEVKWEVKKEMLATMA